MYGWLYSNYLRPAIVRPTLDQVISVKEGLPADTLVTTVQISDLDIGDNAQVRGLLGWGGVYYSSSQGLVSSQLILLNSIVISGCLTSMSCLSTSYLP